MKVFASAILIAALAITNVAAAPLAIDNAVQHDNAPVRRAHDGHDIEENPVPGFGGAFDNGGEGGGRVRRDAHPEDQPKGELDEDAAGH
ncbi:unnamed protein product [Zymoseptoria tritici ST99CH_1A5]|uniref:Uncharacterized protein n=3 Tax=Zymoseptoria tritici TaxID=1047171 RepID=A0A1X7RJT9_ZYMT9|nr:unnamed protein product [Zymoseptoria tritici ST99CH_3D7]SMR46198.1 unnamed protein product [Zymoseptoria tritici ST99CH_1E4]SMR47449.1 unnamed protein product [Zymoseptoria tritici ST99CH_3D1]SMY21346.1 unnamed protein product [Zymoseptoria tritici ST99CH_1A5]